MIDALTVQLRGRWLLPGLVLILLARPELLLAQKKIPAFQLELQQLNNEQLLPQYRPDSKVVLISTYDTTGGNDDGFSGKYSYIRKEGDHRVLVDAKGPGVMHRIHTPTPTGKMLAFYFDGEETPRIRLPFIELFSGKHYPFVAPLVGNEVGGYYCYVPIPFGKSLKIVYEGDDIRFHQMQYRLYPKGTRVESFDSTKLGKADRQELEKTVRRWNETGTRPWEARGETVRVEERRFSVEPGATADLFRADAGGRILGIEIDRDFTQWGRQVLLEAFWNGEQTPAIQAPADDYFGYSFGRVAAQGLLHGSFSGKDYSYLPMPFDRQALLRLRALPGQPSTITGTARIYYSEQKRDPVREGKFYTVWRRETRPKEGEPYLICDLQGKGHYVGTILQAQGLVPGTTIFFEGDDVVNVDDERILHGGGSEDYFNGGWYWILDRWDRDVSLPIHGSLDYSLAYARTGGYRFFLSDKISFEKKLHFTIEHGHEGNRHPVDYTSVAFYYGDRPPSTIVDPATQLQPLEVPKVHEFYSRDLKMEIGPGTTVHFKGYGNYMEMSGLMPTRGFAVDDADRGEAKGQIRLDLSVMKSGRYKLYMTYGEAPDGGKFSVWRRQQLIADYVDTYADSARDKNRVFIGELQLTDQIKTITIRTLGEGDRIMFRLKRVILEEIP